MLDPQAAADGSSMMGVGSLPLSAQPSVDGMAADGDAGKRSTGKDSGAGDSRRKRNAPKPANPKKTKTKRVIRNPAKKDGSDQPM